MEEREAIERLKRGDIGGLEYLVRRHWDRAVRAAYLITRDVDLAAEAVQAAFVHVYDRIGTFDDSRPFEPWFARVVLNDAIKLAARQVRHVELARADSLPAPSSPDDSPERHLERAETADEVWAALGQLPPRQRAAIVQRYYLGLTEAEMATAEACNPSAIKWRLYAARNRLRSLLRPNIRDLGSIS